MAAVALTLSIAVNAPSKALADEGGVSVWLPGFFGSLAAAPLQPGWSLQSIYYHTSVSAGADVSRAREITIGQIPLNLNASLSGSVDVPIRNASIRTFRQHQRRRVGFWGYLPARDVALEQRGQQLHDLCFW
jgi:hypothetical protein